MRHFPCKCGHSFEEHMGDWVACMVRNKNPDSGFPTYADECYMYTPDNLGYFKQKFNELENERTAP